MAKSSCWPHAPMHCLGGKGAYMVTAGSYQKKKIFVSDDELEFLCAGLLKYADKHRWQLQAWAVFSNHYHFVASSPSGGAAGLKDFIHEFHSRSARWINAVQEKPGRKVWHNYRETHLTIDISYQARLAYVHQNAVKHSIVPIANQYPWCSAGWFERTATRAQVNTIYGYKTDRVNVQDDY